MQQTSSASPDTIFTSQIIRNDSCPICNNALENDDDLAVLRQKGANSINSASVQRGDITVVTPGNRVHVGCRKQYINKRDIEYARKRVGSANSTLKRSSRLATGPFNSKYDCMFCGTRVNLKRDDYSFVKTGCFVKSILECCDGRSDDWSFAVKGRVEYFGGDLHAADCLYHQACSVNFRTGRDAPAHFRSMADSNDGKRRRSGRPKDDDQMQAFTRVCQYLEENDEEQLTVSSLGEKMKEFLIHEDSLPFGNQYMKMKLEEKYLDNIFIAEQQGLYGIVTFREKASHVLRSYYDDARREGDEDAQCRAIIEAAAKLIKNDIKTNVAPCTDHYPKAEQLTVESASDFLPETLKMMLDQVIVGKAKHNKVVAIGQAIVQTARPRAVIAPLQIGLAVQMHHLYRSKFLVDTLHEMGFCSSYSEVIRFEKNAATCVTPDLLVEKRDDSDFSVMFAADNVDHNIRTLDGKGTFHGMGMIAAITPGRKTNHIVSRKHIKDLNYVEKSKVDITEYRFSINALQNMKFQTHPGLKACDMKIDVLWEVSFQFKQPVPNWQGMMHTLHQGHVNPGKSSIQYLPMIDMYPGDKTCIISTLEFLSTLAIRHGAPPIITFDQPLYWKAAGIINEAPMNSHLKNIVLMLGTFHTFMNLLGAIGKLMEGTGLKNILELIYGENAVIHIISGKSVQRAFRGHLLVDKCLHQIIVRSIIDENSEFEVYLEEIEKMYSLLLKGDMELDTLLASTILIRIKEELEKKKDEFGVNSKTSQLWIGYQRMVRTARLLIKADRTGNWSDHLRATSDALPIFAAAGHYNYLKSAFLYIQEMSVLESKHPDVYQKFNDGFHVIRRTNQAWAGLGCDLVIEQTLMRSLKSRGGLTHGSKMTEDQRALWTMSAPIMSEFNNAMQDFNQLAFTTSVQHKESTQTRVSRDTSDLLKISTKLDSCSPFSSEPSLRNVVNGTVAQADVNVCEYDTIGRGIIDNMIDKPVFSISFKRKDKVKTMGDSSAVRVAPDRTIDSCLLFQRFLVVSRTEELSLEEVMEYELSSYPPSLFEDKNILRKADKPQLAHAISDHCDKINISDVIIPQTERFVFDGGSLLHKINWKRGTSYGFIAKSYANFTAKHYGSATVVFDGYETGPSIKDNTHLRRGQTPNYPVVNLTAETEFDGKKDEFLKIGINKQKLIQLISKELIKLNCNVIQAVGDADLDIAKAAVNIARTNSITLIGEDTDLLILLLHYYSADMKPLYFRTDNQFRGIPKVYNINKIKSILGEEMCTQMLFLHAFTGCDSTSRVYGIGKRSAFQRLVKREPTFISCANAFVTHGISRTGVENFGRQVIAILFGGVNTASLSALRYQIFTKKVTCSKIFVAPERLPPTNSSGKFHCLRAYYQTMTWMGLETTMDPLEWGWRLENNKLVPIMSDMDAAPEALLKMIHCGCTTGCKTTRCSCKRVGLPCTTACGVCQTTNCDNSESLIDEEIDDDNEIC